MEQQRATIYAKPKRKNDDELIGQQLLELLLKYLNWGFALIFVWLRLAGHTWNHKRLYRIADSPEQGVVDRNLKVWGTQNVYVCSSSAFPTSGQANPTFFLGAFAVRLAHHLSRSN